MVPHNFSYPSCHFRNLNVFGDVLVDCLSRCVAVVMTFVDVALLDYSKAVEFVETVVELSVVMVE